MYFHKRKAIYIYIAFSVHIAENIFYHRNNVLIGSIIELYGIDQKKTFFTYGVPFYIAKCNKFL